jgi:hypothetical protein
MVGVVRVSSDRLRPWSGRKTTGWNQIPPGAELAREPECVVDTGSPAEGILGAAAARRIDLIVMGASRVSSARTAHDARGRCTPRNISRGFANVETETGPSLSFSTIRPAGGIAQGVENPVDVGSHIAAHYSANFGYCNVTYETKLQGKFKQRGRSHVARRCMTFRLTLEQARIAR